MVIVCGPRNENIVYAENYDCARSLLNQFATAYVIATQRRIGIKPVRPLGFSECHDFYSAFIIVIHDKTSPIAEPIIRGWFDQASVCDSGFEFNDEAGDVAADAKQAIAAAFQLQQEYAFHEFAVLASAHLDYGDAELAAPDGVRSRGGCACVSRAAAPSSGISGRRRRGRSIGE